MDVKVDMNPEWKYWITIEHSNWIEIEEWCAFYIGDVGRDWYKLGIDPAEYISGGQPKTIWVFKDEKHAAMFTLRWV